jgi:hypothetical protein
LILLAIVSYGVAFERVFDNAVASVIQNPPNYTQVALIAAITGTSIFGSFPAGMTERNSFRGPGAWNVDVAVFKTIRVREWGTLQLRAEAYNIFNHANLFVIGHQTDISRFGYVPAQRNGRRNLQFAIRFIF